MIEHNVDFTPDDLYQISGHLFALAVLEQDYSGRAGVAPLYFRLASELAGQWSARVDGREAPPVEVPAGFLVDVDQDALGEASQGLERMKAHQEEHRPNDEPWRFVIGLLRRQIGSELATRSGETN